MVEINSKDMYNDEKSKFTNRDGDTININANFKLNGTDVSSIDLIGRTFDGKKHLITISDVSSTTEPFFKISDINNTGQNYGINISLFLDNSGVPIINPMEYFLKIIDVSDNIAVYKQEIISYKDVIIDFSGVQINKNNGKIKARELDIFNTVTIGSSGIDLSGDNTHFSFPIHSSVVTNISNNTVFAIDGSFNETPYKDMSIGSMVFDTSFCYIKLSKDNASDKFDWRRIAFDDNWPGTENTDAASGADADPVTNGDQQIMNP